MLGFVARLIGSAFQPLLDRAAAAGASLARKLLLFLVAGVSFLVVVAALTVAFDLWISSLAGPIVGALAVAGVYLAVGVVCVALALRPTVQQTAAQQAEAARERETSGKRNATIDAFTAPLLAALAQIGLKREQFAVMTGAALAKQLKPVPMVCLAIVAGFLIGRLWKGWDAIRSGDLGSALFGLFGTAPAEAQAAPDA